MTKVSSPAIPMATPRPETEDSLETLAFLVGTWRGREDASLGEGKGEREYRFILNGRDLLSQNVSRFDPEEGRPDGASHEDGTIFSHDEIGETFVVRQFNGEGFVNRFALDASASASPTKMAFVSEASENAPPGLRARLTYEKESDDALRETLELTMPGEDFSVVLRNRWTRRSP